MKNTLVPLDMIFVGADGTVRQDLRERPCRPAIAVRRPRFRASPASPKFVIELSAGEAARDGITAGIADLTRSRRRASA